MSINSINADGYFADWLEHAYEQHKEGTSLSLLRSYKNEVGQRRVQILSCVNKETKKERKREIQKVFFFEILF